MDGKIYAKCHENFQSLRIYVNNGLFYGNGILTENGKEFFVFYDQLGRETLNLRKRSYEGIRIMICKKKIFFV